MLAPRCTADAACVDQADCQPHVARQAQLPHPFLASALLDWCGADECADSSLKTRMNPRIHLSDPPAR
jgi:hypothetical protein